MKSLKGVYLVLYCLLFSFCVIKEVRIESDDRRDGGTTEDILDVEDVALEDSGEDIKLDELEDTNDREAVDDMISSSDDIEEDNLEEDTLPEERNCWNMIYGIGENEQVYSILPAKDNGYFIIVGGSDGPPNWIIKIDEEGFPIWDLIIWEGFLFKGIVTEEGDLIVTGFNVVGSWDIWVLKFSKDDGELIWEQAYDFGGDEEGYDIEASGNGEFIVVGRGPHGSLVMKLDRNGNIIWLHEYGEAEGYASQVKVLQDGSIIVARVEDYENTYIMKLDRNGNLIWDIGIEEIDNRGIKGIVVSDDGNIIVAGITYSSFTGDDIWIAKLDQRNGNIIWSNILGDENDETVYDMKRINDGSIIIVGNKSFKWTENPEDEDILVMKVTQDGSLIWSKVFGGGHDDGGWSVTATPDNGFIVAGYTTSKDIDRVPEDLDALIIKLDEDASCCFPNDHRECIGDSIFWYNLCAERGGFIERCEGDNVECVGGYCKEY